MNNFFGSKLNTVLLLVLIVLMVFAIRIMLQNKELYLHPLGQKEQQVKLDTQTPQISGHKDDLVYFSISPGSKVRGILSYNGVIQGGYFFEGNIGISILDVNKKALKNDHAMATGEWMTAGPVDFAGTIDLSGLPKGPAYFEIQKDNPSDRRDLDKSIFIPIIIE